MQATDDILHKFLNKDKTAFEMVFKVYYNELCSFALKYTTDRDLAEGLVQDLFCYLWDNMDKLVIKSSLRSYLFQSVRNRAFNHFKHQKVKEQHQQYEMNRKDGFEDSDKLVEAKELQQKIQNSILKLPEKCREVFLLSREQNMKYKEIADELNISIKTVENQMGKALKIMRSELGDYLPISLLIWIELMIK